ncbi:hypothetical protein XENOCAPTIV_009275 [Xenoophorus captivus]|uniref:Ankyrin repeat and EF-hand domain containing 1a n=1 Tax=Xenoophorus captivus TaxID=1517983 RepID=A0ABV0R7U7_9TELE
MSFALAKGRLEVLQICRLLQWIHKGDKVRVDLSVSVLCLLTDLVDFLLTLGAHPDVQDMLGRTPVMLAAELGNKEILSLLLQKQPDMRLVDTEGKGVLFYCNYPTKRHARCLQMALKNQADPNNVSVKGVHVLKLMCDKADECTPLCLLLLEAGADPNATNKVIQVLSAFAADMGVINMDNCTPLHYAAATGHANSCKFLAQRGCNPKLKNKEGLLPRQIAKESGHKAAAKELRKAERQHGKGKKSDSSTLMSDLWALTLHDWSNEYEAELREAFGDKLGTVDTETFLTVLEELSAPVELSELHMVILAHDKKGEGNINVTDFIKGVRYIKKAFRLSVYTSHKKKKEKGGKGGKKKKGEFVLPIPICTIVPELKPRRPDGGPPHFMIEKYQNLSDIHRFDHDHPPEHPIVNDSGWYKDKPNKIYININYCVTNGDLESLDLAFSQGVSVDVQDEYYKTPLMEACSSGNYDVAQYLLSKGLIKNKLPSASDRADVNLCDQFFWTPLHHAAHAGHLEIVELLVKAGAAVDAKALSEGTPLMRAIESSSFSCVDFLIKAGAKVNAQSKKGLT